MDRKLVYTVHVKVDHGCVFCMRSVRKKPCWNCPKCHADQKHHTLKNYDPVWRDGDVYCTKCGAYVRGYDAG